MNNYYSQVEKISIIVDITKKLMNFPSSQGGTINLLNKNDDNYSFGVWNFYWDAGTLLHCCPWPY